MHSESHGSGEQLVLIHGWGMDGGFWDSVVPQLAKHFRVHCLDLPGYGYSTQHFPTLSCKRKNGLEHLDAMVKDLSAQFDGPLNVCGWSIGGQVALRWAQLVPQQVRRLVLVASTPCMVERKDWQFGVTAASFRQLSTELEQDHVDLLRRFLTLMVRGSANEREILKELRSLLFRHGQPDIIALRDGLEILRDVDLRAELPGIGQPTLVMTGECDQLTPPGASDYMAQALPNGRLVRIAGAAHVPFLSHSKVFVEQITDFLHG